MQSMRTLSYLETLVFYDRPLVFTARDQVGAVFVCLLVEEGQVERYLCVPVSRERLAKLLDGRLDLREVFVSPETAELFEGESASGDISALSVSLREGAAPDSWLPRPRFSLFTRRTANAQG